MLENTKLVELMVDDVFEKEFWEIKSDFTFSTIVNGRHLSRLFVLYNPRVNEGKPLSLAAIGHGGLFMTPDYEIKEENFIKCTPEMIDSAFCCECDYKEWWHELEIQEKYDKICSQRHNTLKFPCVGCPSSHFDEAYIGGVFVDTGKQEYIDDIWILKTQEGVRIPMSGEQKNKILELFSKNNEKSDSACQNKSPDLFSDFAEKMQNIFKNEDTETAHIKADELICETLKQLGYTEGVKVFMENLKWYS